MEIVTLFQVANKTAGKAKQAKKGKKGKKVTEKFYIDCTHPVEDGIMDSASFVSIFR